VYLSTSHQTPDIFSPLFMTNCSDAIGQFLRNLREQVAQLSQRERAAGCISFGQKWKTETENNILWTLYTSFNHCDVIGQKSNRIRWKMQNKGLLRRSRSFKVIEVGINRKPYSTSY